MNIKEYDEYLDEMGWSCSDDYDLGIENINGVCPKCGMETVDGKAVIMCHWSPVDCDVCGFSPCDRSC